MSFVYFDKLGFRKFKDGFSCLFLRPIFQFVLSNFFSWRQVNFKNRQFIIKTVYCYFMPFLSYPLPKPKPYVAIIYCNI